MRGALEILDKRGLPDLTMRALATSLGVQPSALYWHFANKQDLLAAIADHIVSTVPTRPGDPARVAHDIREALLAYRDGTEIVTSTTALSLGSGELYRRLHDSIAKAGYSEPHDVATTLLSFILGHSSVTQQRLQAAALGVVIDDASVLAAGSHAEFDDGVRIILAGARNMETSHAAPPPRAV